MQQADRRTSYGMLSSLRVLWASPSVKSVYNQYERPPYPIKVDKPNYKDVLGEFRFSDAFMGLSIYGTVSVTSFWISKFYPMVGQRLLVFHSVRHMFATVAVALMLSVPYRRLTGFWDNGLRWKKPENRLNKFDYTSEFERGTIFKHCKMSTK